MSVSSDFQFKNPKTIDNTAFEMLTAETSQWSDIVTLKLNKTVDSLTGNPFAITINGSAATVVSSTVNAVDNTKIDIKIAEPLLSATILKISNVTADCKSGTQSLSPFQNAEVANLVFPHKTIPGKIEAEDFTVNNGFSFETCTDAGAGTNTSYAAVDKYLDYYAWVENSGSYKMDFRVSVNAASAQIAVLKDQNGSMVPLKSVSFGNTGGWQNWQTQSATVSLTAGKNIIRLLSRSDGYNLNWIQFSQLTAVESPESQQIALYPNPARGSFFLQFNEEKPRHIALLDLGGRVLSRYSTQLSLEKIDIPGIQPGMYIVKISDARNVITKKLQII